MNTARQALLQLLVPPLVDGRVTHVGINMPPKRGTGKGVWRQRVAQSIDDVLSILSKHADDCETYVALAAFRRGEGRKKSAVVAKHCIAADVDAKVMRGETLDARRANALRLVETIPGLVAVVDSGGGYHPHLVLPDGDRVEDFDDPTEGIANVENIAEALRLYLEDKAEELFGIRVQLDPTHTAERVWRVPPGVNCKAEDGARLLTADRAIWRPVGLVSAAEQLADSAPADLAFLAPYVVRIRERRPAPADTNPKKWWREGAADFDVRLLSRRLRDGWPIVDGDQSRHDYAIACDLRDAGQPKAVAAAAIRARRALLPDVADREKGASDSYIGLTIGKVYSLPAAGASGTAAARKSTDSVKSVESVRGGAWEEPLPLRPDLSDLPAFPLGALPSPLSEFAAGLAEEAQVPEEMPAAFCLAAVSLAVGRRFVVEPWKGYREPTNLWVAVTAPPGTRKSTVCSATTGPILEIEKELQAAMGPEVAKRLSAARILKKQLEDAEKKASKTPGDPRLREQAERLAVEHDSLKVLSPPRLISTSATNEALSKLLADNDGRMLIASAEGGEMIAIAGGLYTKGRDNFDNLLKGWGGDPIVIDRRGADPIRVESPAVAMALMFQPSILDDLAMRPSFRGRGLLGRFLFVIPRVFVGFRKARGTALDPGARQRYHDLLANLLHLPDLRDDDDLIQPRILRFDGDGAEALVGFFNRIEAAQREFGELEFIRDWASKAHGQVVRITGVLHMARLHEQTTPWTTPVSRSTVEAAIELGDYFLAHAQATFTQMGEDAVVAKALRLVRYFREKKLETTTRRDLQRGMPTVFERADDLDAPLALLEERGYVRMEEAPKSSGAGRKPSPNILVNPGALRQIRQIRHNAPATGDAVDSVNTVESVERDQPVDRDRGTVRF